MTTHTYAGYTAAQIRAAAEAATPGTWSVPEGADDIIAWVDIPIGGALNCGSIHCDHSLANARHVATAQPATEQVASIWNHRADRSRLAWGVMANRYAREGYD